VPLLKQYDWRVTFYLGAAVGFVFIPLVSVLVPETISFLERKRPVGALERIQIIMRRLALPVPDKLPLRQEGQIASVVVPDLFKNGLAPISCILIFAYFANVATYYYFAKWLPTIVSDFGHSITQATKVLGVISLGGVAGSFLAGLTVLFMRRKSVDE
jgi:MFS family permease